MFMDRDPSIRRTRRALFSVCPDCVSRPVGLVPPWRLSAARLAVSVSRPIPLWILVWAIFVWFPGFENPEMLKNNENNYRRFFTEGKFFSVS